MTAREQAEAIFRLGEWVAANGVGSAREGAELMVTTDGDSIDPARQGVLFYLYAPALAALREQLLAEGIFASEIGDGTPGPRQEMRLTDPDGYVLMVAQIEPTEGG